MLLFLFTDVAGVNVAGISAGSVVAVLAVSAVVSIIGLFIATYRMRTLPYTQAKEPPGELMVEK